MAKPKRKISREISWLSFNQRVLQEAADLSVPLLERVKFLGIFANNLDEFFKVRVASLKRIFDLAPEDKRQFKKLMGEKPINILQQIQEIVILQQSHFQEIYKGILQELERENIYIINEKQLSSEQAHWVKDYFEDEVQPILSVVLLQNVNDFPYLKDKTIYLATKLTGTSLEKKAGYALIEVPRNNLPRFVVLPSPENKRHLIFLDDVIRYNLQDIFTIFHYSEFKSYTIKLTRDAELDVDNDISQSFIEKIANSVNRRNKGQPVRFVYDREIPDDLFDFIKKGLKLDEDDNIIPGGRYHNFKDFTEFPGFGFKHLVYPPMPALNHPLIKANESIFDVLAKKDILLHYPYQKFLDFITLLREASMDPGVLSINITLYRVAQNSKIVNALINAARNGKSVFVFIELQARFDETANIYWSKKLEEVGVKVRFGIRGLKIHGKLVLITRKEGAKSNIYAVLSTGNFHEGNATVFADITLLTADKRITSEVKKIFDFLEYPFKNFTFKSLLVSPNNARRRLSLLIDNEIKNARLGREAWMIIKSNNLVDSDMIKKMYQASREGVKIRLIIRGTCSLVPGEPELSENIEGISIVDKYLEHSRIFVFCNNKKNAYYISSADWMARNLDHRIEITCPVYDTDLQNELRTLLELQWADNVKARVLNREQNNPYKTTAEKKSIRAQVEFYNYLQSLL